MSRTVIALLRAVNVGGRRVTMERLRAVCADAGLIDVRTHLASGNVIFTTAKRSLTKLERDLAATLEAGLGFDVDVFLRTAAELQEVVAAVPFPPQELEAAHACYVGFLGEPMTAAERAQVLGFATDDDAFALREREVYWLRRRRESETEFSYAGLERALKRCATFRNLKTAKGLVAKSG